MSLTIREELRTYSKGDLTRITVLATKKQAAAEEAYRRLLARVWRIAAAAFMGGFFLAVAIAMAMLRR